MEPDILKNAAAKPVVQTPSLEEELKATIGEAMPEINLKQPLAVPMGPSILTEQLASPSPVTTTIQNQTPPTIRPVEVKRPIQDLPTLRTYQSDVAEAVKKNNTSVIQIALAESRRAEKFADESKVSSPKNVLLIIASVLFLLLGAGTAVYFIFFTKPAVVEVAAPTRSLILSDSQKILDINSLDTDGITALIRNEKNKTADIIQKVKEIKFVQTKDAKQTALATQTFLNAITPNIPDNLKRSFGPEFFYGFYSLEKEEPFILLKTNSYQNTFAGMLSWEGTMLYDLQNLLSDRQLDTTGSKEEFEDAVIANKDARVVSDDNGTTIFLYSFLDKNTLLIATNENIIKEISARVRAAGLIK